MLFEMVPGHALLPSPGLLATLPAPPRLPAAEDGDGASAAAAAPPGSVVVYANELEYFGDTSTGSIKR